MDRFIRQPEVEQLTGLSRTTIWRRERVGQFPPRRALGGGLTGWLASEVAAWIESRPVASTANDTRDAA
jgi:prophage regulatory protein